MIENFATIKVEKPEIAMNNSICAYSSMKTRIRQKAK